MDAGRLLQNDQIEIAMKLELTDRHAQAVLRCLKAREEGLQADLEYYISRKKIADELVAIREVKECIEEQLLRE